MGEARMLMGLGHFAGLDKRGGGWGGRECSAWVCGTWADWMGGNAGK